MNELRLPRPFSRTLTAALALALVLCGCQDKTEGTAPTASPAEPPYEDVACDDHGLLLRDLSITPKPDFLQLRSFVQGRDPQAKVPVTHHTVEGTAGTPCRTATDRSACQGAFENLGVTEGFNKRCAPFPMCDSHYVAFTRGDEVGALTTKEAFVAFLGTIDTPQEAALVAYASGFRMCNPGEARGQVGVNPDGSFNVIGEKGSGCGANNDITRQVLRVTKAGEITELKRTVIMKARKGCILGHRPEGLRDSRDAQLRPREARRQAVALALVNPREPWA